MNCEEANRISMIEYLSGLGYQPKKMSRVDYWYLYPLREETSASFKVNAAKNCWYDHGLGKGGTLVDFVKLHSSCDVSSALQIIASSSGGGSVKSASKSVLIRKKDAVKVPDQSEAGLVIIQAKQPVTDHWLSSYAKQRNIPHPVLNKWCYEVDFAMHDKQYKAIGFKNDAGGYELRNNWFKGSSSPKAVIIIKNNSAELAVFEGFFDFLSYQSVCTSADQIQPDYMILNSLSFFESKLSLMQEYKQANLLLDNDSAGRKWTEFALQHSSCFQDKSDLYRGYKDLNDWHVNFGKKQFVKLRL